MKRIPLNIPIKLIIPTKDSKCLQDGLVLWTRSGFKTAGLSIYQKTWEA
jgi:hypothetical protein